MHVFVVNLSIKEKKTPTKKNKRINKKFTTRNVNLDVISEIILMVEWVCFTIKKKFMEYGFIFQIQDHNLNESFDKAMQNKSFVRYIIVLTINVPFPT